MPTLWHILTYLFGVCLFSISFLVFVNSTVSFVITDIIGQRKDVGTSVGTLGFVDELVALVACPFWGLLSDRIGLRTVRVSFKVYTDDVDARKRSQSLDSPSSDCLYSYLYRPKMFTLSYSWQGYFLA